MYSAKSFQITKGEWNYLLPVLRSRLLQRCDRFYFIADNSDELKDMLSRLQGYYDTYSYNCDKGMVNYDCYKSGSIAPFRESINIVNVQFNK